MKTPALGNIDVARRTARGLLCFHSFIKQFSLFFFTRYQALQQIFWDTEVTVLSTILCHHETSNRKEMLEASRPVNTVLSLL